MITNTNVLTSSTTVYTSTGNTVVSTIHLCNQSGSTVTANLYVVPSGGTAGVTNIVYKSLAIAASDTYITNNNERFILGNGDFIAAAANVANSVITTVTYTSI